MSQQLFLSFVELPYPSHMNSADHINEDNFAVTLRLARERAGLTQRELGKRAGVNYSQVSRYEQGAALPRPGMLIKLAEVLGVSPDYLREGEDLVHVDVISPDGERLPICFQRSEMAVIREMASANGRSVEEELLQMFRIGLKILNGEAAVIDPKKPAKKAKT